MTRTFKDVFAESMISRLGSKGGEMMINAVGKTASALVKGGTFVAKHAVASTLEKEFGELGRMAGRKMRGRSYGGLTGIHHKNRRDGRPIPGLSYHKRTDRDDHDHDQYDRDNRYERDRHERD